MKKKYFILQLSFALLIFNQAFAEQSAYPLDNPDEVVTRMVQDIKNGIEELGASMSRAAKIAGQAGLTSQETRKALSKLCNHYGEYLVDCSAVDDKGVIVAIEPDTFRKYEGLDTGTQQASVLMSENHTPILSDIEMTFEGIPAVLFRWPVFTSKEDWIGSIGALLNTPLFMKNLVKKNIVWSIYDAWIVEKSGKFLYSPNSNENGHNIFTDPYFKYMSDFVKLGKRITKEPSGVGIYHYPGPGQSGRRAKRCTWNTLKIYNIEVRVVLVEKL